MAGSSGRSLPQFPSAGLVAIPPLCTALSGGTAALILTGYSISAGIAALVCAALLIAAETRGRQPVRGMESTEVRRFQFGSRVSSSIFDAAILLPLAWTERITSPRVTVIALVGLGTSYLVSYQLARGQALGYSGWESTAYRIGTAALLIVSVLAGSFHEALLELPLWVFGAVTGAAAFSRASDVRAQDRQGVTPGRTS